MLEKVPRALGRALRHARPGLPKLSMHDPAFLDVPSSILVTSPMLDESRSIPIDCTADGDGISPAIEWKHVPEDAEALVLVIEDADSPTRLPLVHALVWDLAPSDGGIEPGALNHQPATPALGRNSMLLRSYLPPDPPPGHGAHRYAFEVLASDQALDFEAPPGRSALLRALRGHVIAKGCLVATYERV